MDAWRKNAGGTAARTVGRYVLCSPIAAGGMAVVHLGRLLGPVGFTRTVAIKRVHPNFLHDHEFVAMFVDEAHLAARIHHPNVVPTLDVVVDDGEVLLVMEYVHGESLSQLMKAGRDTSPLPLRVCSAILTGVLHGLHAAHEARGQQGEPLNLVHRDVSPHNILVGADGIARVIDFGVAKAAGRLHTTREGRVKGKLAYMAPEQLGNNVSRQTDIYSAAVVAWEIVTGKRLVEADDEGAMIHWILYGTIDPPSEHAVGVPPELDAIIMRGLEREPERRFATAREMALALEACVPPALASEVATVVEDRASQSLNERAAAIVTMESSAPKSEGGATHIRDAPPAAVEGATQSQMSVISESQSIAKPKPQASRLQVALALGTATLAVAAVVLVRGRSGPDVRDGASNIATGPPPSARTPTQPSAGLSAEPSIVTVASGAADTTAAPVASAAVKPPSRNVGRAPPVRPEGPAPGNKAKTCDPPYTIDSIGRKIYKRECF